MIEIIAFLALIVVIIFLIGDRYFITEQFTKKEDKLLEELSRATKAVISKNANEYVMTTSIDKVEKEEKPEVENDQVEMEELNQEEWEKAIGIKRNSSKK